MNIEVEIRSFISEEKFEELLKFFNSNARFINEDDQETWYFDCDEDLRIQRNRTGSKVWLKKGKLHDYHREEIEIKCPKGDFDKLHDLFTALGYDIQIKWFRKRFQFDWRGIKVCLDHTSGYGYIIELEQISNNEHKDEIFSNLLEKLRTLKVDITPKDIFEKKFEDYKKNWRELTSSD